MKKNYPKILIVDDKRENLLALNVLLSEVEAEVISASSGYEAINLTHDLDFALALVDIQMPEMSGFEVAEIFRGSPKTEHLPIIFVSAIYSGDFYHIKGIEAGAIDFLEKPIIPELLLGKVSLFLELYRYRNASIEKSFFDIAENISDGLMVVTKDQNIQIANSAAEYILCANEGGLENAIFNKSLVGETLQEFNLPGRDGEEIDVEINVSSIDWQGDPAYIVLMRDITERNRAKKELQLMVKNLNTKNAELESFNYTVSHDLKTPLITMGNYSGLLHKAIMGNRNEDALTLLTQIRSSIEEMYSVLDHLLAMSLIGQNVNEFESIDMNALIINTANSFTFENEKCPDVIKIDNALPPVKGDKLLLAMIFQNLLENSFKFMGDQSAPEIEIGFQDADNGGAFYVKDNGSGFDPIFKEKIFGLFKRLNAKDQGAGIGLTAVKKAVQFQRGEVWAESPGIGQGATFFIQLSPDR